jgi:hypothetical protein
VKKHPFQHGFTSPCKQYKVIIQELMLHLVTLEELMKFAIKGGHCITGVLQATPSMVVEKMRGESAVIEQFRKTVPEMLMIHDQHNFFVTKELINDGPSRNEEINLRKMDKWMSSRVGLTRRGDEVIQVQFVSKANTNCDGTDSIIVDCEKVLNTCNDASCVIS